MNGEQMNDGLKEIELSNLKSYRRRCKKDFVQSEQYLLGAATEYTRAKNELLKVDLQIKRATESQQVND